MPPLILCFLGGLLLVFGTLRASAHEFWIDGRLPTDTAPAILSLDLKVGQNLTGVSLPYVAQNIAAFRRLDTGQDVPGVLGDIPAARIPMNARTGVTVFHQTYPLTVRHTDWAAFQDYLAMEGLQGIAARHIARGLPKTGFSESYTRFAKLVVLGYGATAPERLNADALFELRVDRISTLNSVLTLRGTLTHDGRALTNHQITVFERVHPAPTTVRTVQTDTTGAFLISTSTTAAVLLNAVHIRPADDSGAVWHSDWASLGLLSPPGDG